MAETEAQTGPEHDIQAAQQGSEGPEASRRPASSSSLGQNRVRPMEGGVLVDEEPGFFLRLRERLSRSSVLGFQEQRKRKNALEQKPTFSLLEIFYRHVEENGQRRRLTIKERFLRGYQMGNHLMNTVGVGIKNAYGFLRTSIGGDPDEINPLPGEKGRLNINGDRDQKKHEEEAARTGRDDAGDRSGREGQEAQTGTSVGRARTGGDWRVMIDPEDLSNRIGSDHVGPERQVRRNDDPWPLDKPRQDRSSETRKLAGPEQPRQVSGPTRPRKIAGPERPAQITDQRGKGEAAAERGRAAAHELAARKAAEAAARKAAKSLSKGAER